MKEEMQPHLLALAEQDFLEAAERASAHVSKYFPDDVSRVGAEEGDLLILAQVDAWRALVAIRQVTITYDDGKPKRKVGK